MKKKYLAALICLFLTLTLLPAVALADAFPATGLDLSGNPAAATYTAGSGTVVWNPDVSPATLTFNNATITASNANPNVYNTCAVRLPGRPVTVTFNGTNSITANNMTTAGVFRCTGDTVFNLATGSETTLATGYAQNSYGISSSAPVEIRGEGKLNINAQGRYAHPIYTDSQPIRFTGGTLAFSNNLGVDAALATLGGVTIPAGKTLNLQYVGSVVKGASGAVNNGALVLKDGATPAQIAALGLTGSGIVKVGNNSYTNGGQRIYTSPLLFSEPAASGGWKENATLAEDGYNFTGSASSGYTLTLGNLLVQVNDSNAAIRLPADGPVRVVLADGTTARVENAGSGIAMQFLNSGADHPCNISGGGKLVLTAEGRSCLETRQPLTIAGGDITMVNGSGYAGIDAQNTALTVSGGKLNMNAKSAAVQAGSVTLQNGMIPVNPAGAKFLDGVFRLNGNMVAHLVLGVGGEADVPQTGDATPLLLLCGLLLLSGAGLAASVAIRRKRRNG